MQAWFQLLAATSWVIAGMVFVTGSLNSIFGWNLGVKTPGSMIEALPSDFPTIVLLTLFTALLGGVFYVLGNFKQTLKFIRKHRWLILGSIALVTATAVIGLRLAMPNLGLELAVQGGNSTKAQALLQKRDYPVKKLNDLLYWSLQSEDYALTEMMLSQGADINRRRGEFNSPLLHDAVMFFPASATDFLLAQGIDINAQDDLERNALHILLSYRVNHVTTDEAEMLALVQRLVDAGIDINVTSSLSKTPIAIAQNKGYETVVAYLEQL